MQQLLNSASANGKSGKELMAAAVATMVETAADHSAMPKKDKLVVSNCPITLSRFAASCWLCAPRECMSACALVRSAYFCHHACP